MFNKKDNMSMIERLFWLSKLNQSGGSGGGGGGDTPSGNVITILPEVEISNGTFYDVYGIEGKNGTQNYAFVSDADYAKITENFIPYVAVPDNGGFIMFAPMYYFPNFPIAPPEDAPTTDYYFTDEVSLPVGFVMTSLIGQESPLMILPASVASKVAQLQI